MKFFIEFTTHTGCIEEWLLSTNTLKNIKSWRVETSFSPTKFVFKYSRLPSLSFDNNLDRKLYSAALTI